MIWKKITKLIDNILSSTIKYNKNGWIYKNKFNNNFLSIEDMGKVLKRES